MYLLDTDVVSRTSPVSIGRPGLAEWLQAYADHCYLSVISLSELQYGVTRLMERGAHQRAASLQAWLGVILDRFADRLLSYDLQAARRTGELLARVHARGFQPDFEDACIAATAECRGLVVITYNTRHFEPLGVSFRAPGLPEDIAP